MAKFVKKSDHLEEAYKEKSGAGAIGIIWAVLALLGSIAFFQIQMLSAARFAVFCF